MLQLYITILPQVSSRYVLGLVEEVLGHATLETLRVYRRSLTRGIDRSEGRGGHLDAS